MTPRKIPYLLIWKDERHSGEVLEAVRLTRQKPFECEELNRADPHEYAELKRPVALDLKRCATRRRAVSQNSERKRLGAFFLKFLASK